MKFIFLISFFSISILAQKPNQGIFQFNFKAEYIPAKVTFNDGHVENGFIYGFIENRKFEINLDMNFRFGSIENDLNLDDKVYDFKTDINGEKKKLTINDINEVVLIKDSNFIVYRLFNIKKANGKDEIIDSKTRVWLPLIRKDIVNVYGYDVYNKIEGSDEKSYMLTILYLQNENENFAIPPIDFSGITLFNFGKTDDKMNTSLKYIFKDCPEFVSKIDSITSLSKEKKKNARDEYYRDRKQLTELKKGKSIDEMDKIERDYFHDKLLTGYIKLIDEYKKTCPK